MPTHFSFEEKLTELRSIALNRSYEFRYFLLGMA